MISDIVTATALKLRECSTLIPVELDDCIVLVDLSTLDMDELGCGLSNAQKPKLLQAYRPDMKAVDWWTGLSKRTLKTLTTPRLQGFTRELDVISCSGRVLKLNPKGTGVHKYLGISISKVFGFTRTVYCHNLIGAESMIRCHKNDWNRWGRYAFDADYMTWTGYTVHHILPMQTATKKGNTPLNLILLDDHTHNTTRIYYNRLKRRIIDGDVDISKMQILFKK